jgi:hypothetical protein
VLALEPTARVSEPVRGYVGTSVRGYLVCEWGYNPRLMSKPLVGLCVALMVASACNDKSPSDPSDADVTALAITLRDVVLAGTSATATATATLSNGQTQSVTTGFRSDTTAVATTTDGGNVSGVANGESTISVTFGGMTASKRIRVAPNYAGRWQGNQRITTCTATEDFAGLCDFEGGNVGDLFPVGLVARHPSDLTVSGEFSVENLQYPTFTTDVRSDGTIAFSSTDTVDGIRGEVSWQLSSTGVGAAAGTIREIYSVPGEFAGTIVYESTLTSFTRISASAPPAGLRTKLRAIRRR